ncbi:aminodeoxychorismate synthase component I [Aureimonas sp. AU40]|uniref:aminodeoxychorismate synthase component I n=1 Tax=Aureimonas sp. AU40 TaxID=1637747 RepID=UPI000781B381|nr:aminodeoxychorismate synthase component I [Aureimonas sp. AU40]
MWREAFEGCDAAEAARRLRPLGRLAFLDSAAPGGPNGRRSAVLAAPFAGFTASLEGATLGAEHFSGCPFAAIDQVLARYHVEGGDETRLGPGLAGFISYEAGHFTEQLRRTPDFEPARPLIALGLYDTALVFDHETGRGEIVSSGFSAQLDAASPLTLREAQARRRIGELRKALATPPPPDPAAPAQALVWRSDRTVETYAAMVERVRDFIRAGDIYQANVARRFEADLPEGFDPFGFYRVLRRVNPAPFAAYLDMEDRVVASASPELFLRLRGRDVETRPIKGTARRMADSEEDTQAARALLASAKDRAENVMIVDLLRNDLSRVAEPDSVEVPSLCALESFAGVHHLVSEVRARLRPEEGIGSLLRASFPGGSITGAPKIRACDIITELEGRRRDLYCGAIAHLGFDGAADLSIAIRTVEFEAGRARFGAGGGVTILSEGEAEFRETATKAQRILDAFAAYAAGAANEPGDGSPP